MNLRYYYLFEGVTYGIVALVMVGVGVIVWRGIGLFAFLGMGAYFAYRSSRALKSLRETADEERLVTPFSEGTPAERIAQIRTFTPWFMGAIALLSVVTALQLYSLEVGWQQRAKVVFPVGWIYRELGYWPAVMAVPSVGLLLTLGIAWKMRQLKREGAAENGENL